MDINKEITRLINYALDKGLIEKEDKIFTINALLEVLELDEYKECKVNEKLEYPTEILEKILDWAYENGRLKENSVTYRDLFDTKIMAKLMPRPSEVIRNFYDIVEKKGIEKATDNYYAMSKKSNYIRTDRIAKNEHWYSKTEYGDLEITINLSKPEKDPKAIAAAKNMPQSSYPKCLLCVENEGYAGRLNHPARQNHRVIPITLTNEPWNLQYSPYVYYNEHSIIFSSNHRPMKIDKGSFDRLLEFVEKFPHYFIGSNADLPIVGGSILSHDHFQGGRHIFPMEKAHIETFVEIKDYEDIEIGIVKWPMSVIRINGKNRERLSKLADKILRNWREYSDESLGIYAYSKDEPHNTITPIARRRGLNYEIDLVLRNNRTSKEHPLGIFHPHNEVHNIKKENIGLIEVMGLAVLPGRLKHELRILEKLIIKDNYIEEIEKNQDVIKHLDWVKEVKSKYNNITFENAKEILKEEVGIVFSKVLEHAGVYKRDKEGLEGIIRFIQSIK
ncbi:UDP-glucose--hexose-1-phosphate uridylyltransferase [Hypnocyclicus thermotrophus]|uniref:UDP-glucose--hexose-1-phosphate uridylyltransferase n=1 Tax=Hypnocyclicus thermotrophus TaxID=1627895 RepID=UPI00106679B2|nr:UDP-glucose--hexose-1-phosphate uridylyltransferase [Hypnocyclicus thermotrophus]